jgi:hypothetical protein
MRFSILAICSAAAILANVASASAGRACVVRGTFKLQNGTTHTLSTCSPGWAHCNSGPGGYCFMEGNPSQWAVIRTCTPVSHC